MILYINMNLPEILKLYSETVVIVISGDFNSFYTVFLEIDLGLTQIVLKPTHGNNI